MSKIRKKETTEAERAPAGPHEIAVRHVAETMGWTLQTMPSLDSEPGWISARDPKNKVDIRIEITRGEATDDDHWKTLYQQAAAFSQCADIFYTWK